MIQMNIDYFAGALAAAKCSSRSILILALADEVEDKNTAAWLRSRSRHLMPQASRHVSSGEILSYYWGEVVPNKEIHWYQLPAEIYNEMVAHYKHLYPHLQPEPYACFRLDDVRVPSEQEAWAIMLLAMCSAQGKRGMP